MRPPIAGHARGSCTDYPAEVEIIGADPVHRLIVRGICLDDANDRLWLLYTWVPGLTEPMDGESGVALNVEFGADTLVDDGIEMGAYEAAGGAGSDGEIGYTRPLPDGRRVWFDFGASDDPACQHPLARLTLDLTTGNVTVERPPR